MHGAIPSSLKAVKSPVVICTRRNQRNGSAVEIYILTSPELQIIAESLLKCFNLPAEMLT